MNLQTFNSNIQEQFINEQVKLEESIYDISKSFHIKQMSQGVVGATKLDALSMIKEVEERIGQVLSNVGRKPLKYRKALELITPSVASHAALRQAFSVLSSEGMKSTAICASLGGELASLIKFSRFKASHSSESEKYLKKADKLNRDYLRNNALKQAMNSKNFNYEDLDVSVAVSLGKFLLTLVSEVTGLFEFVNRAEKNRTIKYFTMTDKGMEWITDKSEKCALAFPRYSPMVIPPVPWSNMFDGAYLNKKMLPLIMVRCRSKAQEHTLSSVDMSNQRQALNILQETPWRINPFIHSVISSCLENGIYVKGLENRKPLDRPEGVIPDGLDSKELVAWIQDNQVVYEDWSARSKEARDDYNRVNSKKLTNKALLDMAEQYSEYPAFYFPWTLDYRGRIYPVTRIMSPQGDDVTKNIMEFAAGQRLGETGAYWLHVHTANTFGADKITLDDRVLWVAMRYQEIKSYVENPIENLGWTEADKPFAFLAACEEIVNWLKHGDDAICHIAPAMDGSCSGLQHFSAMLKDEETAIRVNVLPSDVPQDIYKSVSDFTLDSIAKSKDVNSVEWKESISRSIVKRPTMTTPYGVSARGIEDQITEEVIKQASDGKIKRFTEGSVSASKFLAPKVSQAINKSAKSARQCMEWFQECSLVFSKNNLSISWETPSGMFCLQDNRKVKGETVNFIHKGRRERITVNKPTKTVDAKKQKSSIAPNVVHSFDAAHLCMSVIEARNQGVQMFNMIHDSFACPASHTGVFNEVLRGEFVSLYDRDVLKDLYEYWLEQLPENQKVKLPPPPKQGDMDLALVKQSLYFFA